MFGKMVVCGLVGGCSLVGCALVMICMDGCALVMIFLDGCALVII